MRGKQIMTVTGPVNANLLGTVYSHEHLIVQPQIPDEKYIAYTLSDENASAKEVQLFANAGGKTIVEMTPINYGRDVLAYQRIAKKTGIYVICCTGFHKELFMPSWFKEKKSSQIYDEVLNEIENGIDKTSIRPGVIKMGTSFENITDQERRAVEIVARLHQDTGIMISTHCDKGTMGIEQLDLLEHYGVSAKDVLLGHIDSKHDIDYAKESCKRGAKICIDHVGRSLSDHDAFCVQLITELIEAGFVDHVVLSGDMGKTDYLLSYGGTPGFGYILTELKKTLLQYISEEDFSKMLIKNPQQFLSGNND